MTFFHRLRTKLIFAFTLVTLIPTLIIGVYAIQVSSHTLKMQALAKQTEQVKILENIIKSFLSTVKRDLLFLTYSAPMKEYLLRVALFLESPAEQGPSGALASSEAGKQAMHNILEQKRHALEQEFLAFSRSRRIYYQIRYLDKTGREVVRIDSNGLKSWIVEKNLLQNKSGRYYFKETIRLLSKQVFVSKLDLNREQGQIEFPHKPVIRYAVNVYYPNNQRAGIVIINVDATQLLKKLGDTILVDQNGFFLNHPDQKKRWGSPQDLKSGYTFEKEYPYLNSSHVLGRDGTLSTNTITLSHQRVIVPGSSQQWTLVILRDTKEILLSVMEFRVAFSIILTIAIIIAILVALISSAKIIRPIEHLTQVADAISRGELVDNRVEITDKGEIGQLARAFERMRVSMIKSFERLRKQRM